MCCLILNLPQQTKREQILISLTLHCEDPLHGAAERGNRGGRLKRGKDDVGHASRGRKLGVEIEVNGWGRLPHVSISDVRADADDLD
jgi:hypothetical protein